MAIVLDEAMLAKLQAAQVDISVHVTATLNVTPFVARQKVNVLLLDKVGTGLLSEAPDLAASEGRLYWRVQVALALPGRGDWARWASLTWTCTRAKCWPTTPSSATSPAMPTNLLPVPHHNKATQSPACRLPPG